MEWSPEQNAALADVSRWLSKGTEPVYRLFGYAGSGKTTLAKHFAQGVDGPVSFGAFTGKAAHVLQQKGCIGATTIHQLMYQPKEKSRQRLRDLEEKLEEVIRVLRADNQNITPEQIELASDVIKLRADIRSEEKVLRKPAWGVNPDSDLRKSSLIIIDECSMVDQRMGEDLLSFEVPILVLGDPAQLPPVGGEGYFTRGEPNKLLTQIHRQAADNPILRMAHMVREGRELRHGQYGSSKVIDKSQIDRAELLAADQVIVGKNKSRTNFNNRLRELKGFDVTTGLPARGDKVICLRNNHELGILNGSLWNIRETTSIDHDSVELDLTATVGESTVVTSAHSAYFRGGEPKFWDIKEHECFDYGYAITCHKSQGSQYDNVYIFDESSCFRQDARKWLYTAITRAANQVTVVS